MISRILSVEFCRMLLLHDGNTRIFKCFSFYHVPFVILSLETLYMAHLYKLLKYIERIAWCIDISILNILDFIQVRYVLSCIELSIVKDFYFIFHLFYLRKWFLSTNTGYLSLFWDFLGDKDLFILKDTFPSFTCVPNKYFEPDQYSQHIYVIG